MAWPLPDGAVLAVFASKPEHGRLKPALVSALGPELAAEVEDALLFDLLDWLASDRVFAPGGRRVVVFDPPDAGPWFDARVPESFALQPQAEGDQGACLQQFLAGEFADGAEAVVAIGADAPTIDPSALVSAFLCLQQGRDVVVGPSTDGGYYLVGLRKQDEPPALFEGIERGTRDALSRTIDRLQDTGLTLAVLTPHYRVETADDLRTLSGHLRAMRRAGMNPALPRTEAIIERLIPRVRR